MKSARTFGWMAAVATAMVVAGASDVQAWNGYVDQFDGELKARIELRYRGLRHPQDER